MKDGLQMIMILVVNKFDIIRKLNFFVCLNSQPHFF